jgi:hypothetical protein
MRGELPTRLAGSKKRGIAKKVGERKLDASPALFFRIDALPAPLP